MVGGAIGSGGLAWGVVVVGGSDVGVATDGRRGLVVIGSIGGLQWP